MKKETIDRIRNFSEDRDWDQFHNPENLAKSISIEAGELLECFQWNNEYDKQGPNEDQLFKNIELALSYKDNPE